MAEEEYARAQMNAMNVTKMKTSTHQGGLVMDKEGSQERLLGQ